MRPLVRELEKSVGRGPSTHASLAESSLSARPFRRGRALSGELAGEAFLQSVKNHVRSSPAWPRTHSFHWKPGLVSLFRSRARHGGTRRRLATSRGGSQSIAEALAGYLRELGGTIELDRRITDLKQLPKARVVLLDVTAVAIRAHGGRTAALELPQPTRALQARARRFQNGLCALRRFHGRPKHVVGLEPSMWGGWTKLPPGNGKWRKETSRAPIRVGSTAKSLRSNARA